MWQTESEDRFLFWVKKTLFLGFDNVKLFAFFSLRAIAVFVTISVSQIQLYYYNHVIGHCQNHSDNIYYNTV